MVTVDPADQQRLLEVQALDTRLDQVQHTRATLPEAARAAELETLLRSLRDDVVLLRTKVSDLDREVARAENDVQAVRTRAERDRARLEAGQGSAKDLVGLQHELESLARRQSDLEDAELEVMERREEQAGLLEATEARLARTESEHDEAVAARDVRLAELASQEEALRDDRKAAATGLPEAMTRIYERLRDRLGSGAAPLVEGRCDGCRMPLAPSDLHALTSRPADELLRCPECERILVRDAGTAA
ncbi:zinc ribbon domain-containing protein [Aquipuribacter nitratireducens]|uniref:Zinc ribbon domain-containing protein n=1 Tax=Aquipuribacter nitratireducens TaxID=650104 RepID=A0ABW0GKE5_9MICO